MTETGANGDALKPTVFTGGNGRIQCWLVSGNETLQFNNSSGGWFFVYGNCFGPGTDYLAIYDEQLGAWLDASVWMPISAGNDGSFVFSRSWHCGHTLEVWGYDSFSSLVVGPVTWTSTCIPS